MTRTLPFAALAVGAAATAAVLAPGGGGASAPAQSNAGQQGEAVASGRPSTRGLTVGFFDPAFTTGDRAGTARLDDARRLGAGVVRVQMDWRDIAASEPDSPKDPDDPAYQWERSDGAVAAAADRGFEVLLAFTGAPSWAEGRRRPNGAADGAWQPNAKAVGAFATAVARRYAEQADGVQVWNEPNLDAYLAPQWKRGRPFAPARYREMLNAAYPGVTAAGLRLVTAGTAPFGDPGPGTTRIPPVTFWDEVLERPTRFDVFAHHPYSVGGPRQPAVSSKDVALPDMGKLVSIVRSAVRAGRALPDRAKPIWVTEVSWDSKPPDPNGVPAKRHARWLAEAFYVLWREGVDHVLWFQVRDARPRPSFAATNQSGVLFADGGQKVTTKAFRFPFACERVGARTIVWALSPRSGPITIESIDGDVISRLSTDGDGIAYGKVAEGGRMRAVSGGTASIACRP